MATLNISNFSCLTSATFEAAPVSVIIGPQGSGKSVTTKLFYFFSDILTNFLQYAERGDTIEDYKRNLSKQFSLWFPPSAWGSKRFTISYSAGDFSVRVLRRKNAGRLADDVAVTFSKWFTRFYRRSVKSFARSRVQEGAETEADISVSDTLDKAWRVRTLESRRLANDLGAEYLAQQTFIPAGRAFFTSIGRLVAGFEQAGSLDPITVKFAKLLASLRDRSSRRIPSRIDRFGSEFVERRRDFMREFFGGEIRFESETEYVETDDGRKIPFSSLSSGQQELLPMWSLLDYFSEREAMRYSSDGRRLRLRRPRELIYIEEPEAHLFPSAQSALMELLIGSITTLRSNRGLIITTHSPYIMAKLNVFLKAGQLSKRRKRSADIARIVPRNCWLLEGQLSALSIQDGELHELVDDDGLIDARYLDEISEEISREFSALLKIESEL